MFIRNKFVTNSSSTCFIAFGVYAEVVDEDEFKSIDKRNFIQNGVRIAQGSFESDYALFYLDATVDGIDEYSVWQPIDFEDLPGRELIEATEDLANAARSCGCEPVGGPEWGLYISGH